MNIEHERAKMNRLKVQVGIEEMKFKILELKENIKRIEKSIGVSEQRLKDIDEQIKSTEG